MLAQTPPHHSSSRPNPSSSSCAGSFEVTNADRRCFGSSTDDVAIFLDDTLDRTTVRCLSSSPSAVAILSPQRLPTSHSHRHTDATEIDLVCNYAAGMSSSAKKKRAGGRRAFANELTNTQQHAVQSLSFGKGDASACGTPCAAKAGSQHQTPLSRRFDAARGDLPFAAAAAVEASVGTSPMGPPPGFVPFTEYERMEKERNRYQKMYEHQRGLYEDMVEAQQETYQKLQDKIVEVVAISTRNEESKKFIRQLKREMLESRTRALDLHNRQWEESRTDRTSQDRVHNLLAEQEAQFTAKLQQQEARMAGLEGLIRDLTSLRGDAKMIQIAQLDQLLKASYTKNAALFGDLVRQGRQLELVMDRKVDLERTVEAFRRERRDLESNMASERRLTNQQNERFSEQITDQQRTILELRQCLVRAMASADSTSSESPRSDDSEEEEEGQLLDGDQDSEHEQQEAPLSCTQPQSDVAPQFTRRQARHSFLSGEAWDLPAPPPPPPPASYLVRSSSSDALRHQDAPVRPVRRLRAVPPAAPPSLSN